MARVKLRQIIPDKHIQLTIAVVLRICQENADKQKMSLKLD